MLPLAGIDAAVSRHGLVRVDRTGTELSVIDQHGNPLRTEEVEGSNHPVHKVRGGGLSHRNIQNHAEETARHNMDEVAGAVTELVRRVNADRIIVSGEVQARSALRGALPDPLRDKVSEVDVDEAR